MAKRNAEYVRLDDIVEAERNPKLHDIPGIIRSLAEFGVTNPIGIWDERTGRIVAGHGRRQALLSMHADGRPAPDGVEVNDAGEWLVPVWRGWSSKTDEHASAYLIADNRLTEKGGIDERELLEMLAELDQVDMLELTAYDADDFAALEALYTELPPSFDGDQGDLDDTDRAGWPTIRAKVAPEIHDRFMLADGNDDAERIAYLVNRTDEV